MSIQGFQIYPYYVKDSKMRIIKYILVIALLFALWVTKPLWMPAKPYIGTTTVSPVDIQRKEQQTERKKLIAAADKKNKDLEDRFGKKPAPKYSTGVLPAIYIYWNKTLSYPKSLEEERCGPIHAGNNGWVTVCRYRVKSSSGGLELRQDTYIIKNGVVVK